MTRYYLIPAVFLDENGEKNRVPKYIAIQKTHPTYGKYIEYPCNWSSTYIESIDRFVVMVNSRFQEKHDLLNQPDVEILDDARETKDRIRAKIPSIKKIDNATDTVTGILKQFDPSFKKTNLWVDTD